MTTTSNRMSAAQFAAILTRLKAAGITAGEIAEDMGVNRVTIYRWASGTSPLRRMATKAVRDYAREKLG